MSGFYKKAVVWLGLNEEYPDDEFVEPARRPAYGPQNGAPRPQPRSVSPEPGPDAGAVRPSPQPTVQPTPQPMHEHQSRPTVRPGSEVRVLPVESSSVQPESAMTVRPVGPDASAPVGGLSEGTVRAIPMDEPVEASAIGTVRPVAGPTTRRPNVVIPKSFNDAQRVGDLFKDGEPVIVNLENAERDLARRLIDFASGLCYGLGGQMEKVAKDVYLLTPTDVSVSDEDRRQYSS